MGHRRVLVAEDLLEGEDVATVSQVLDGEGVTEAMGMYFVDPGAFAEALEVLG